MTDQPGSREGYVGVLRDAEIEVCAVDGGALRVEGTVTNPEATVQSYRIYVSAMHGTDTRGLTQVDVAALDPEVTATWTAELDLADDDLTCLLRVERFEP